MSNISTRVSQGSGAMTLIRAAALASALVPLGAVTVDGATIVCESNFFDGSGCAGQTGLYEAADDSNIWKFTDRDGNLIYSLQIAGTALPSTEFQSFRLEVSDQVIDQDFPPDFSTEFADAVCIPMFDADNCTIFRVSVVGQTTDDPFPFDYEMTMTWFTNPDGLSQPSVAANNRILKAATGSNLFAEALTDSVYNPTPDPDDLTDPALGGRGNSFSEFIGTTTVPEPGTLLLLGTGAAAALIRRRSR